MTGKDM